MANWTPEQQASIEARNHTVLVAAAAGSGKTTVLIDRILSLIREGARLNRMLIVTFTKAAAGEMRERLQKRLMDEAASGEECIHQALDDVEAASISTIHVFCQHVLKTQFQCVGIDPMARLVDEPQRKALFEEAWHQSLNTVLESEVGPDMALFVGALGPEALLEVCTSLYTFMMALKDPFEWLDRSLETLKQRPIGEHPWVHVLRRSVALEVQTLEGELQ